jgi:hypothetical protein
VQPVDPSPSVRSGQLFAAQPAAVALDASQLLDPRPAVFGTSSLGAQANVNGRYVIQKVAQKPFLAVCKGWPSRSLSTSRSTLPRDR